MYVIINLTKRTIISSGDAVWIRKTQPVSFLKFSIVCNEYRFNLFLGQTVREERYR